MQVKSIHDFIRSGDLFSIDKQDLNIYSFIDGENSYIKIAVLYKRQNILKYIYKKAKETLFEENILDQISHQFGKNTLKTDAHGRTELHWAIACGLLEETENLMRAAKNKGVTIPADNDGNSLLHYACYYNNLSLVTFLITEGAAINCPNKKGMTPLNVAVMENVQIKIIEALLAHNADVNHVDAFGHTPLAVAYNNNSVDIIERLVREGTLNFNFPIANYHKDPDEHEAMYALCLAAKDGNDVVARILIKAGADVNSKMRSRDYLRSWHTITALTLAIDHQHFAIAKSLLDAGADIQQLSDCLDKNKEIPTIRMQFSKCWSLSQATKNKPVRQQLIEILKINENVEKEFFDFSSDQSNVMAKKALINTITDLPFAEEDIESFYNFIAQYEKYISPIQFKFIMAIVLSHEPIQLVVETNNAPTDTSSVSIETLPVTTQLRYRATDTTTLLQLPFDILYVILMELKNPVYLGRLSQVNKYMYATLRNLNEDTLNNYFKFSFQNNFENDIPQTTADVVFANINWKQRYAQQVETIEKKEDDEEKIIQKLKILVRSNDLPSIIAMRKKHKYPCQYYITTSNRKENCLKIALQNKSTAIVAYIYDVAKKEVLNNRIFNSTKSLLFKSKVATDINGYSQLHWAVCCGLLDETKALMSVTRSQGVDPQSILDEFGNSLLHLACYYNHLDIVRFLLEEHAVVDAVNTRRSTPLCSAIAGNVQMEIFDILVQKGANVNHRVLLGSSHGNEYFYTPLAYAIDANNYPIVQRLLKEPSIDVHQFVGQFANRLPYIFIAAKNGQQKIIDALIKAGAHVNQRLGFGGLAIAIITPLIVAVDNENFDVAQCLLAAGADIQSLTAYPKLDTKLTEIRINFLKFFESKQSTQGQSLKQQVLQILETEELKENILPQMLFGKNATSSTQEPFKMLITMIKGLASDADNDVTALRALIEAHAKFIPPLMFKFIMQCILMQVPEQQKEEANTYGVQ